MWFDTWQDMWQIFVTTILIYAALDADPARRGQAVAGKAQYLRSRRHRGARFDAGYDHAKPRIRPLPKGRSPLSPCADCNGWSLGLSLRATWFKKLIRSEPRLLLSEGKFLDRAMRDERILRQEVHAEIRNHGFADIEDIAAVVLETDGSFSVIPSPMRTPAARWKAFSRDPVDPVDDARPAR